MEGTNASYDIHPTNSQQITFLIGVLYKSTDLIFFFCGGGIHTDILYVISDIKIS